MSQMLLPPELAAELARQPGRPLRVTDPTTKAEYVLVDAESFDQLTSIDSGSGPGPTGTANGKPDGPGAPAADFPAVGTPEWGQMNRRRADLIRKKLRGELTEAERQQYEWLQRRTLEALDAIAPRPGPTEPGRE